MKNKTIIEFNCMCCGKKFTDLSPIHEKRCVCLDCYKLMKQETFMKEKDQVTIKRLKQLAKKN